MMQRFIYMFLLLPWAVMSMAQENVMISGKVTNEDGKPMARAVCRLKNANDSLLAYCLTNQQGAYLLKKSSQASVIEFSFMGYSKEFAILKDGEDKYDVVLRKKAVELEEVTVSVSPIRRDNDTLFYNVNSFRQKEDKYIEDVLKRVPGIEVSNTGKIKYQGMDINQVNIEGHDLMGSQYNLATQNMPAEAVSQIQVMKNNQPIRALEGKVSNNRATLNIKLNKNYKLRPFGELLGNIGIDPYVWNNRLTALQLGTKNQWFVNAGMSNHGNRFSQIADNISNVGDIYTQEDEPEAYLYSPTHRTPPVSPLYYLQNNTWYTSLNYMRSFSKESSLRSNLLYYHDYTTSEDSAYNQYFGTDTTTIFEADNLGRKKDILKGQLRYELNSKKLYLHEELTGKAVFTKSLNNIDSNLGGVEERTRQKPLLLQNVLQMNVNTPSRLFQVSSIARYYHNKEQLNALPDTISQGVNVSSFFMRNRIGSSLDVFGRTLMLAYIMEYKNNDIRQTTDEEQRSQSYYWLHTLEAVYEINFSRGCLLLRLPVERVDYHYDWRNRGDGKWMFSPSVDLNSKLGNNYNLTLQLGYNKEANTSGMLTKPSVIAHNYRSFSETIDSLSVSGMTIASTGLSYINTSSMFSWNIYGAWTRTTSDIYLSNLYFADMTYSYPVWRDNKRYSWSAAYSMRKVFRNVGLTISHSSHYSYNKALYSQNNTEDYIRYNVVSTDFSFSYNKLVWLHLNLTAAGNISWKQHDAFSMSGNVLKNAYYTLRTDIFTTDKLQLYADFSQTTTEISHGRYSTNCFFNAGASYVLSKVISIELSSVNLFNRRFYRESVYSGATYSYYSVPLRKREVMIGLRVRF